MHGTRQTTRVLFTFGGLPHYYNKVLNRLNQQDDLEIIVVSPLDGSSTIGAGVQQNKEGIEFRLIQLPEKKAWYGKAFFSELLETIQNEQPDIVVTVWPYILGFLYNRNLKKHLKNRGIKLLFKDIPFLLPKYDEALDFYNGHYFRTLNENMVTIPNGWLYNLRMRFLTWSRKQYYSHIIDAHVNYVEGAEDILSTYGVRKESVFVTYNSPDTDLLFETKRHIKNMPKILPNNANRILHVGRLVKWKRVDLLIDAFAKIIKEIPDAELVILGKGPELENLKEQAVKLNLIDSVQFIGAVYKSEDLGRYFNESTVYVLAGMGGLSINEAMAYGKPIVCSICDGTEKHLVKHGENGFLFENGNIDDLANKVETILVDKKLQQQMGTNSEKLIQKKINIETVIAGYKKAFDYLGTISK